MKIEFNSNEKCSLENIKEGDCFMDENVLYVKTDYLGLDDSVMCVQMFNGHAVFFKADTLVDTVSSNVLKIKQ